MKKVEERIIVGIILIVAGIFLVLNQFMFKISFFPWILLVIGVILFLISLFSRNIWGGLQSLLWFGGLAFAFYYDQLIPGILIIIGFSIILGGFRQMFYRANKVEIHLNDSQNLKNNENIE
mgnify:CR=1 FL=1